MYYAFPAWSQRLGGTFITRQEPAEFQQIADFIQSQDSNFRVLWFPEKSRYSYYTDQNPLMDPRIIFTPYSWYYFMEDWHKISPFGWTQNMGKLLGILNVKDCVLIPQYPQDSYKFYVTRDRSYYEGLLDSQQDLTKIVSEGNVTIYRNNDYLPKVYFAEKSIYVVGGFSTLVKMANMGLNFSDNAVFFAEQPQPHSLDILNRSDTVIFYGKDMNDLTLTMADQSYQVNLRAVSGNSSNYEWYHLGEESDNYFEVQQGEFVENKGGFIQSLLPSQVNASFSIQGDGLYDVWARVGFAPLGNKVVWNPIGNLTIGIDDQFSAKLNLGADNYALKWVKAGSIALNGTTHSLSLANDGEVFVDSIKIVPHSYYDSLKENLTSLIASKNIVAIDGTENLHPLWFTRRYLSYNYTEFFGSQPLTIDTSGVSDNNPSAFPIMIQDIGIPTTQDYYLSTHVRILDAENESYAASKMSEMQIQIGDKFYNFSSPTNSLFGSEAVPLSEGLNSINITRPLHCAWAIDDVIISNNKNWLNYHLTSNNTSEANWTMDSSTSYSVELTNNQPGYLVFSEQYDSAWFANMNNETLTSSECYGVTNSYYIDKAYNNVQVTMTYMSSADFGFYLWIAGTSGIILALVGLQARGYLLRRRRKQIDKSSDASINSAKVAAT
jgi:hypothetical protein